MTRANRRTSLRSGVAVVAALGFVAGAHAEEGKWSLQIEPIFMDAYGHDQHVLTIHRTNADSTEVDSTAVNLDTESGPAFRFQAQRNRETWSWGFDFLWYQTSQDVADQSVAAGGSVAEVVFETADRRFTSPGRNDTGDPQVPDPQNQPLFYGVLGDTSVATWTLDVYAARTLAESSDSRLDLRFGLRNADFDNDYRAVIGVRDVVGTRLDASSNYSRMMGPVIGLDAEVRFGRHHLEGYFGQSLIFGEAELTSVQGDYVGDFRAFSGPVEDIPDPLSREVFHVIQDVAFPVTDFRIKWTYDVGERLSLGAGIDTSVWWDVMVPPGIVPGGSAQTLHENTIAFFGLSGVVSYTF